MGSKRNVLKTAVRKSKNLIKLFIPMTEDRINNLLDGYIKKIENNEKDWIVRKIGKNNFMNKSGFKNGKFKLLNHKDYRVLLYNKDNSSYIYIHKDERKVYDRLINVMNVEEVKYIEKETNLILSLKLSFDMKLINDAILTNNDESIEIKLTPLKKVDDTIYFTASIKNCTEISTLYLKCLMELNNEQIEVFRYVGKTSNKLIKTSIPMTEEKTNSELNSYIEELEKSEENWIVKEVSKNNFMNMSGFKNGNFKLLNHKDYKALLYNKNNSTYIYIHKDERKVYDRLINKMNVEELKCNDKETDVTLSLKLSQDMKLINEPILINNDESNEIKLRPLKKVDDTIYFAASIKNCTIISTLHFKCLIEINNKQIEVFRYIGKTANELIKTSIPMTEDKINSHLNSCIEELEKSEKNWIVRKVSKNNFMNKSGFKNGNFKLLNHKDYKALLYNKNNSTYIYIHKDERKVYDRLINKMNVEEVKHDDKETNVTLSLNLSHGMNIINTPVLTNDDETIKIKLKPIRKGKDTYYFTAIIDNSIGLSALYFKSALKIKGNKINVFRYIGTEAYKTIKDSIPYHRDYIKTSEIYLNYYNKDVINDVVLIESFLGQSISGNPYYFMKEIINKKYYDMRDIYVSAKNVHKIKKYLSDIGLNEVNVIERHSEKYCEILSSAKYLFNNHNFPDYFIKKENQIYINTWHGTPLKTIGRDVGDNPIALTSSQRNFLMVDYFPVSNELTKEKFLNSYMQDKKFNGEAIIGPSPRNSIFYDKNASDEIRSKIGCENKRIFVYMPTWRGSTPTMSIQRQAEELTYYFEKIEECLGDNDVMFVKLHNFIEGKIHIGGTNKIKKFPPGYETYEFLSAADCLITDYSSVMFDYVNSGKEIILFMHDYDEYRSTRGMYFDPLSDLPFTKAMDINELVDILSDDSSKITDYKKVHSEICKYDSLNGTSEICEYIFENKKTSNLDIEDFKLKYKNKKRVLINAGSLKSNNITESFFNKYGNIECNDIDYTFCFLDIKPEDFDNVSRIPAANDYFSIKSQRMIMSEREREIYTRYLEGCNEKEHIEIVNKIFKRESKRLFYNTKWEELIDFSGDSSYINLLFGVMSNKSTIYVHKDIFKKSKLSNDFNMKIITNTYKQCDEIAITHSSLRSTFLENLPEVKDKIVLKVHDSFNSKYISHSGGGVDKYKYTNCAEGFDEGKKRNHKFFEVDLKLTADNIPVGVHRWDTHKKDRINITKENDKKPMYLKDFLSQKIYSKYTPIKADFIINFLNDNPEYVITIDCKHTNIEKVSRVYQYIYDTAKEKEMLNVLERIMPQVYNFQMYDVINNIYNFPTYLFSLYKILGKVELTEIVNYCEDNNINVIGISLKNKNDELLELIELNKDKNIDIAVYTTNNEEEANELFDLGVKYVFTDFLYNIDILD